MKSATYVNRFFLRQKTVLRSPGIRSHLFRAIGIWLVLMASACVNVPVDTDQPSAATKLEIQQKIFQQAKALFLDKQYTQAANALLLLARQGHVGAQYTIGYMYHHGYGVPRNEKESIRWITTAAARGYPQAEEALIKINASHDQRGVLAEPIQTLK